MQSIQKVRYIVGMSIGNHLRRKVSSFLLPDTLKFAEQFAFGHREVLLTALGLPSQTLLRGGLQHGWVTHFDLNHNNIPKGFRGSFPYFTWNLLRRSKRVNSETIEYIPLGSPWAHLYNFIEKNKIQVQKPKQSTPKLIYFPRKSHYGWDPSINFEVIQTLSKTHDVSVCLYWLDFVNYQLTQRLRENNIDYFCVGYRGSSTYDYPWLNHGGRTSFLFHLYCEIKNAQAVIVDDVGSAFWYALSLDKPVRLLSRITEFIVSGPSLKVGDTYRFIQDNNKDLTLTGINYDFDQSYMNQQGELTQIARTELGWQHLEAARNVLLQSKDLIYSEPTLPKNLTDDLHDLILSLKPKQG